MTLEEKVGQLIQYMPWQPRLEERIAAGGVGCIFGVRTSQQTDAYQRIAVEQSRLHIPLLFAQDIVHGCHTIFPIPLGIASSWDLEAAELEARVAARESRAVGIRWTFAPMVDITRDPRWGRVAEGAGEDPLLGSAMAAAYVRGFQEESILACPKHFAAYGAAEGGRDYNTVEMSEQGLREVYLPPFKAAIDAGAQTIMSAFDALNGIPTTANHHLLTTILRKEWHFEGFVASDYDAVDQLRNHGIAATPQEAALKAIQAGVDMDTNDGDYETLVAAVREGLLPVSTINTAVRRVLKAKFELGLFERPYTGQVETALDRVNARRVADESIVLLKNDGALLPLPKTIGTLAVIGPLADSKRDLLGSHYALGNENDALTLLDGIRSVVSSKTRLLTARGCGVLDGTDEETAAAVEAAKQADAVILALGETGDMTGEGSSRAHLDLPGLQERLLEAIVAAGKPVVLVVMSGRPLTISWAADHVPAIVWPWFPGIEGGPAIAGILFGDVNPSAKLPISIPRSVGQVPVYYAHLPTGRPPKPDDKYTSKYIDVPNEPLYPFGHGLAYTTFTQSKLRIRAVRDSVRVSAEVCNTGRRAGVEIVQFYVHQRLGRASRPVKELKGFLRVDLAPGEARRVGFKLSPQDLRYWLAGRWVSDPGTFDVWIGPSSTDGIAGSVQLTRDARVIH
jgi:beta-glucosidase